MNGKSLGMILLAVYLILVGLLAVTNIEFVWSGPIVGILALCSGVCLLIGHLRG